MAQRFLAQAFGLRWQSDTPIPWFAAAEDDGRTVDVVIERCRAVDPRPGGRRINQGELFDDGTRFAIDGATIDMFDGNRIRWSAPDATEVPLALTSTVAAHLMAWRGLTPLHGSAVAFDGGAILIAGKSGAGKSTLADALVAGGGRLVSDDLSVLLPVGEGERPLLLPGRPGIRLNERIGEGKDKPKLLALPPRVDPDRPVPLVMLLELRAAPILPGPAGAVETLIAQLFRPTWMRALPHAKARTATLFHTAHRIAIAAMPPAAAARDRSPAARADDARALMARHGLFTDTPGN